MALGQKLTQNIKQVQTIRFSLELQLAVTLLRMNDEQLEEHIKEVVERNPFISEIITTADKETLNIEAQQAEDEKKQQKPENYDDNYYYKEEYDYDDSDRHQQLINNTAGNDLKQLSMDLLGQLNELSLTPEIKKAAGYAILVLEESGYMYKTLQEASAIIWQLYDVNLSVENLKEGLKVVKTFEPAGVGAESIREAFLTQLQREGYKDSCAYRIIRDYYDEYINLKKDYIITQLNISPKDYERQDKLIKEIAQPHFCSMYYDKPKNDIPDAEIFENGEIRVNSITIKLDKDLEKQIKGEKNKEAKGKMKELLKEAKDLKLVTDWRNSTLIRVVELIYIKQKKYIDKEETTLQPLSQKEMAKVLGVNTSTICNALKDKTVKMPYGTIVPLSTFFSKKAKTSGIEVSDSQVEARIQELVEAEDKTKPLTDERITELLQKEGITYKHRAVTKHRKRAGLPSSLERKIK